ncbi:MAG TPA: hypothetical protein VFP84_03590 [Kofleriaceae bacterium]|nr:hypothetical protein [Kofleriaceae bacterium]
MPTKRAHRPQKAEEVSAELEDTRPLNVRPFPFTDDRLHNPKDLEVDEAAIRAGVEHGGTIETHAEARAVRGSGGRKRSRTGPAGGHEASHRAGRDITKKR